MKDTFFYTKKSINCKGKLVDLSSPIVMGILNVTPDSFFDGNKYTLEKNILDHTEKMITEGAAIIDIGGYSSRPGADDISVEEELSRTIPAVKKVNEEFPESIISIDTFRSKVAEEAINSGATIVNDISGGNLDDKMFETIGQLQVPYIMMHMQGSPKNMQNKPKYENINKELIKNFSEKIDRLKQKGVHDIIIDPGFGFGKTLENNYEILQQLELYQTLNTPILIGASRKSMINKLLNIEPKEALNGTTVINTIATLKGASILRVHDVKEATEAIKIINFMREASS